MKTQWTAKQCLGWASFLVLVSLSGTARAATFNVTDTAGLAAALTAAQNNNEDDVINIAAGEYDASAATFTYLADNTGGSEENFSLAIVGENRETTILDGGDMKRVLSITTFNLTGGDAGAAVTVRNLTIQNGRSTGLDANGGGLLIDAGEAEILVDNCLLKDNFTDSFGGGADLLSRKGNATLTNSVFIGNEAVSDAGGAEVFGDVNATAINNVFFGNQAGNVAGGALVQFNSGEGVGERVLVVNNTVISNTSGGDGGGLFVALTDGDPERAEIFNNVVFGNTATGAGDDLFFDDRVGTEGAIILLSNNDIGEFVSDCDVEPTCAPSITEQSNLNLDPGLIDPASGNFHLASDSPLIDKGSADAPQLPAEDFEGDPRVQGDAPDIGADETVLCGDGTEGPGEECDDGNNTDGDGCSAECLTEEPVDDDVDAGGGCSLIR